MPTKIIVKPIKIRTCNITVSLDDCAYRAIAKAPTAIEISSYVRMFNLEGFNLLGEIGGAASNRLIFKVFNLATAKAVGLA